MFCVGELGHDNDVPRAVDPRDPARCGECVEPHGSKCYNSDDHAGGEDMEQQTAVDGADTVLDGVQARLALPTCSFLVDVSKATLGTLCQRQASLPSVTHDGIENLLVW